MEQESKTGLMSEACPSQAESESLKNNEDTKFSYASIKPTKSTKMSALSRIKAIQENDWKIWEGVNVKKSGRPGTSGLIKPKSRKEPDQQQIEDDLRQNSILQILTKMQALEDDNILAPSKFQFKKA